MAARSEMRASRADYAVMLDVRRVDFGWRGVLTARGKVRVLLVDGSGTALYDQVVRTGTVVGSRGDRHGALIRFIVAQAVDIAFPRLRERIR